MMGERKQQVRNVFSWDWFHEMPVIGIARNISPDDIMQVLPFYLAAGLTTIEITMNTPGAVAMIKWAVSNYGEQLNIGAGTVCSKDEAEQAMAAGACFIVTPVVDLETILYCKEKQLPIFCGAYTPTEIYQAWRAGADVVKVFPCPSAGYINNISAPLSNVKLLPTGGVGLENCAAYLALKGVCGVGVGGGLFDESLIRLKHWVQLSAHFEKFVESVRQAKAK